MNKIDDATSRFHSIMNHVKDYSHSMKSRLTNEFALSKKLSVQTMDVHMCLLRKIGTST